MGRRLEKHPSHTYVLTQMLLLGIEKTLSCRIDAYMLYFTDAHRADCRDEKPSLTLAALCAGRMIFDPGSKVMNANTE